ncbi:alpha/beta-hydrolase, partial [Aureobasidium melanogenum]
MSTNGLCSGTANTTFYTDSCGQQYQVYCSADSSPGAYATLNNVPDFATCMSYCSAAGSSVCTTVTYVGTACYLKQSFSTIIRPSSGNTATIYYAPPAYPAPVANGQYRSSGCGTPLNSAISAGGASSVFYGNGSDGYVHSYNVHVPSGYDPNKAAPLILVFHGRGESGSQVESETGFSLARINPYGIAVYPTAIQDSTGQPTWQGDPSYVGNTTINDLNFVRTLVANISSQYCIDTSRVFAAGFSNGGGLVNVLACDPVMSTVFNAFAPHSGAYYTQTSDSNTACFPNTVLTNDLVHSVCSPSGRVPMIEFHGDNDQVIPYFGGGRRGYCLPAIPHWSQDWATRNNLTTDNVTTVTNGGNVTKAEFGSLSGLLGLVTQFRLAGWPHEYSLGSNSGPIDAAAFSLDFFYRWTNPAGPSQDYLSSIYASTTSARVISCPSTLSITTTTTT